MVEVVETTVVYLFFKCLNSACNSLCFVMIVSRIEIIYHWCWVGCGGCCYSTRTHVHAQGPISMIAPASIAFGVLLVLPLFGNHFGHLELVGKHEWLGLDENILHFFHYFGRLALFLFVVYSTGKPIQISWYDFKEKKAPLPFTNMKDSWSLD